MNKPSFWGKSPHGSKHWIKRFILIGISIIIATLLVLINSTEPTYPQVHPKCSNFFNHWQNLRNECGTDCMRRCRRARNIFGGQGIRNPVCEASCNSKRGLSCTLATEWNYRYYGCENLNNAFDQVTREITQLRHQPRRIAERNMELVCNKGISSYQTYCTAQKVDSYLNNFCLEYQNTCINKGFRNLLN